MFRRIRTILWGIKYSIEQAIAFKRAITGLQKRRVFSFKKLRKGELFKLNPWIEYVAMHSSLSYVEAIDLYDKFSRLPWKLTNHRINLLTKLIMEQAGKGIPGNGIDILKLAADIEGIEKNPNKKRDRKW
jgi:hypothetical protein